MKLGLVLPHFGSHANTSRLFERVVAVERMGFDSVWVRDHVVYRPHAFEDQDITFVDPMAVLAGAAARTQTISLGTATMIPFRHPIHTAMQLASLAQVARPERLIIGWGRGNDEREFEAVGMGSSRPGARLDEHVQVVRELLSGQTVSHHGEHYEFDDVRIASEPVPIKFWYGGRTSRALQRIVQAFDGLLASRIPRALLAEQIAQLAELSDAAGRPMPEVATVALVSPGASIDDALAHIDVERIHRELEARFAGREWPRSPGDDGVLLAGPPSLLIEEFTRFAELGVGHIIIDLRARFADWEAVVEGLAREVVPVMRKERIIVAW